MATALITLGRLPKALTLARHLSAAGYRVVVAEPFKWHLALVSRAVSRSYVTPSPNLDPSGYRACLLDIIEREEVTLVIPVSEEIHHVLPLRGDLPPQVLLFAPNWNDYLTAADKLYFAQRAQSLGLAVPTTHIYGTPAAENLGVADNCIYKPRRGCSGVGIVRDPDALPAQEQNENTVVQTFIDGQVISSLTLVVDGSEVQTVVYQGKVFSGTVAICFEQIQPSAAVIDWIHTWTQSFEGNGFIALDFIIDPQGQPWGIECNPRLTSGIHFFTNLDQLAAKPNRRDINQQIANVEIPASEAGSDSVPNHQPTFSIPSQSKGESTHAKTVPATAQRPKRWQWGYSTLTEAYGALFRGDFSQYWQIMKLLRTSRDCVWSWRDPLPFLLMTPLSISILWPAIKEGLTLGEACQRDIAPLWDRGSDSGVVARDMP